MPHFFFPGGVGGYRFGRGTRPRKFVFNFLRKWHRLCGTVGGVDTSAHLHLISWPLELLQVGGNFSASSLQTHCVPMPSLRVH